jgi:hypothetical protein|tara:strand:+ start:636 stop:755 length:120 start_codon:yes stop_codon:yes gene_type:complete
MASLALDRFKQRAFFFCFGIVRYQKVITGWCGVGRGELI